MSLYEAVRVGSVEDVRLLLNLGGNVNAQGGEYGNPLQAAVYRGNQEMVELLLIQGADVNAEGGILGSALQAAAYQGYQSIIRLLLDKHADVNARNDSIFGSALQAAAYEGREDVVKLLLAHGADVNAQGGEYSTALQAATYTGRHEIVKLLLANGADINIQGGVLGNALQAAVYGSREIVESRMLLKLLLGVGANINAQGGKFGNALQAAAYKGNIETIKLLLAEGANVNALGGEYGYPLQAAAYKGSLNIVKLLLSKGAEVNAQGGKYGSALQAAANRGRPELIRFLLDKGADINAQGGEHGNTLQAAIYMKRSDIVSMLLARGVDMARTVSADGSSLLHLAVASQDSSTLKLLIRAGAASHMTAVDAFGQTPLHLAALGNDIAALQTMSDLLKPSLPTTLDINGGDIDGCTPLHRAVEKNAFQAAEWLVSKGARTDIEDYNMTTPFQRALAMKNLRMMHLLFPHTTTSLVKASDWRSCLPPSQGQNIMLTRHGSGLHSVQLMDSQQLMTYLDNKSYSLDFGKTEIRTRPGRERIATISSAKVIVLLENDKLLRSSSIEGVHWRWWRKIIEKSETGLHSMRDGWSWRVRLNRIPAAVALQQPQPEECFLECRVLLPGYKVISHVDSSSPLAAERTRHAIIWIMVKPTSNFDQSTPRKYILGSKMIFSTLEYAEIPQSPAELFLPCIQQLEDEWNDFCDIAERHLSNMRTKTFHANGRNTDLVKIHLSDAEMWTRLNEARVAQIKTLRNLIDSYDKWPVLQEDTDTWDEGKSMFFRRTIDSLDADVKERIAGLTKISQELIQLEFNLTSIAEAQKSTSTNRSLKRLSWITFIFLPLMFISSLFGMNVNILESNPPWWIYIPFAIATTALTLIGWLIFKRNSGLEDSIERRFNFLFSRQRQTDEESSFPENDWIYRTENFPRTGKKRS